MVIKQSLSFYFFSWSVPENRGSKRRLRWLSFTVCGFIELKTAWSHDREILNYVSLPTPSLVSISKYVDRKIRAT